MPAAPTPTSGPTHSLAQAMVVTSATPLLLLDGDLTVIATSLSFCRAFGLDPASVTGNSVFVMGDGEWDMPRLHSLLTATGSGGVDVDKYEMELGGGGAAGIRCLELSARKLDYEKKGDDVRLLLSVHDTTVARASAKERKSLFADNLVLMQELQHRVANSLQIIASVLMQSARRVSNHETRTQLQMAQTRVLSIAEMQKQLSQTGLVDVALRPYFAQLCRSIGASMIADPELVSIEIDVDDSNVHSNTSVSLGLIATELVINSLKHAYPMDCGGKITVRYRGDGDGWKLVVEDDGLGMPAQDHPATAGLGTSIIRALARQLNAHIVVAEAHPGTRVSIVGEGLSTSGQAAVPLVQPV